jgi:epsin
MGAVREKTKQLLELLGDNERIREERDKARKLRDKFVGIGATGAYSGISGPLGGMSGGGSRFGALVAAGGSRVG